APFSPTSAWISPCLTVKLTSFSAFTGPKDLLIPRISSSVVIQFPRALCHRVAVRRPDGAISRRQRYGRCRAWSSLASVDLGLLVIAAVDQDFLPIGLVDDNRLEQIGRHHLDAIVVGLGVVHLHCL